MPKGLLAALPSFGIVIITAACLAGLSYADYTVLFRPQLEERTSSVTIKNPNESDVEPQVNVTSLFGTLKPQSTPIASDLPETRLQLILKGTFTHNEEGRQSALINANKGLTVRYFLGDDVSPGASIVSIEPGIVTLRRNGQDEILKLPLLSEQHERLANTSQKLAHTTISPNQPSTTTHINSGYTKPSSQIANQHKIKLQERLEKLRANQRKN